MTPDAEATPNLDAPLRVLKGISHPRPLSSSFAASSRGFALHTNFMAAPCAAVPETLVDGAAVLEHRGCRPLCPLKDHAPAPGKQAQTMAREPA